MLHPSRRRLRHAFRKYRGQVALPLTTLLLVSPALAFALLPESLLAGLRYERDGLLHGEWWRWVSAHWVHLGPGHLWLNVVVLSLVVAVLAPLLTPGRVLLAALVGTVAVGAGLLIFSPAVGWYVGLSGVTSAIWASAAVHGALSGYRLGWLALGLLMARLAWEQAHGPLASLALVIGGQVVVDAHLYGGVGGAGLGLLLSRRGAGGQ